MTMTDPRTMADAIRFLSIDAIERVGEGHPGTPLGAADTATALFTRHLKFNPKDPLWFDRDRVVQSNGHGSMLLYSLLHLSGYEKITLDDIKRFRELGSHCEGHPGVRPDLRDRGHDGPPGPGHRQRGRHGACRGVPEQWLGRGSRRSLHLRLRRGRLPPGGRGTGGHLAGRAPAPGKAGLPLGRQPHDGRRGDRPGAERRHARALPVERLACAGGRRPRYRCRVRGDPARQEGSATVDDPLHDGHRPRPARGRRDARGTQRPHLQGRGRRRPTVPWLAACSLRDPRRHP